MTIRPFLTRCRNAAYHAFGLQPMRRTVTTYPDDVWLTSYPKSGNTWTRFLIAHLIARSGTPDFANIEGIVPDVYANGDATLRRLARPRFIKSHEPYCPQYRRVLLIVRDPRDVAISYFHFARKMRQIALDTDFDTFLQLFLNGGLDDYGSWGENVGSWLGARSGSADFLVVRYEDLLADTAGELERIASTFGIEVDPGRIRNAVSGSSADRLRELEITQGHRHKVLKRTRPEIPFIRNAGAGQWRAELSASSAGLIEHAWAPVLRQLGY